MSNDESTSRKAGKKSSQKALKVQRPQRRKIETVVTQLEKTPSGILKKPPDGFKGLADTPETRMVPSLPQLDNPKITMKYTELNKTSADSSGNVTNATTSSEGSKLGIEVKYSSSKTSNSTNSSNGEIENTPGEDVSTPYAIEDVPHEVEATPLPMLKTPRQILQQPEIHPVVNMDQHDYADTCAESLIYDDTSDQESGDD